MSTSFWCSTAPAGIAAKRWWCRHMYLLPLPPYAPELNPVEHLWDELREKHFHNRVFDSLDALEEQLVTALHVTENATERVRSIVAWPWIIDALMK
jgi:transposase